MKHHPDCSLLSNGRTGCDCVFGVVRCKHDNIAADCLACEKEPAPTATTAELTVALESNLQRAKGLLERYRLIEVFASEVHCRAGAASRPASTAPADCGEYGHAEGTCGNAQCIRPRASAALSKPKTVPMTTIELSGNWLTPSVHDLRLRVTRSDGTVLRDEFLGAPQGNGGKLVMSMPECVEPPAAAPSADGRAEGAAVDGFRGDNAALIASAKALLNLDARGAVAPHGIGSHARDIISAFVARMDAPRSNAAKRDDSEILEHALRVSEAYCKFGWCKETSDAIEHLCAALQGTAAPASVPAVSESEGEREQLRAQQAQAVMPLIGPLLDEWEGLDNDTKDVLQEEASELLKLLGRINRAMEGNEP